MRNASGVKVGESLLAPVRALEPPEHVVEGAILHHQYDDVFDARELGRRQPRPLGEGALDCRETAKRVGTASGGCGLQKAPAGKVPGWPAVTVALRHDRPPGSACARARTGRSAASHEIPPAPFQ